MRLVIDCFLHLSQRHSNAIISLHFYSFHHQIDGFIVFVRGFIVLLVIAQWGCFFAHITFISTTIFLATTLVLLSLRHPVSTLALRLLCSQIRQNGCITMSLPFFIFRYLQVTL